jgi:YD repeat-containing protein
VSYTTNAASQYTAVGATTPTDDANGNVTGDGTFTYGYDAENRLTSASGAGNTVSYSIDSQGHRKSKTVNGTTTITVNDAGDVRLASVRKLPFGEFAFVGLAATAAWLRANAIHARVGV